MSLHTRLAVNMELCHDRHVQLGYGLAYCGILRAYCGHTVLHLVISLNMLQPATFAHKTVHRCSQDSRHVDYDEAQLGSAVQSLCFVLPGSVKDRPHIVITYD